MSFRPHTVAKDLIAQHGLTEEEYQKVISLLGREPNLTELGMFSVMWSEHCSYKSSRAFLKKLPTDAPHVIQGPGENAGADRKSTRLNSSHLVISYAVFCLKKKKNRIAI